MPPLQLLPNQPVGSPDWQPTYHISDSPYGAVTSGPSSRPPSGSPNQEGWYEAMAGEMRRQNDRDYQLRKRELDDRYNVAKLSARSQEERNRIDQEYNRAQIQLAQARLAQEQQQFQMSREQREAEFARTFGLDQARLDEQKRQFNATGQLDYARLAEQKRQFDQSQGQQNEQFYASQGQQNRQFYANLGENARQFDTTNYLNQARLGYDVVNQQAQYEQHPEDYWVAADNARGVAAQTGTATFLDALQNGGALRSWGAQAGTPQVARYGSLVERLRGPGQAAPASGPQEQGGPGGYMVQLPDGSWTQGGPTSAGPTGAGQERGAGYQPMPTGTGRDIGGPGGYMVQGPDGSWSQGAPGGPTMFVGGGGAYDETGGTYDEMSGKSQGTTAPNRPVEYDPSIGTPNAGAGTAPSAVGQMSPSPTRVSPYAARDQQNLQAVRSIYERGAGKLGNGALENLSPTEYALLKGSIRKIGGDEATFLSQYQQSRIGNRIGAARVA